VACTLQPAACVRRYLVLLVLAGCAVPIAEDETDVPCTGKCDDTTVTPATLRANLLANLIDRMDGDAVMFGQQRFNLTGVNADGTQWLATTTQLDRSDVTAIAGQHPIVMGLDAWDLAIKPETWAPSPSVHAAAAKHVHAQGGIVTMDWHMRGCAVDSFNAPGNEACLCKLANDDAFARTWLLDGNYAKLADALIRHGLDRIPIVFRPMHEHNGSWFWWGEPSWNCAAHVANPRITGEAAYQRIYRTIVHYLRVERGLDNLLIAYSPDRFGGAGDAATTDAARYLTGYPGDEFVDVLGIDLYYRTESTFAAQTTAFRGYLDTIEQLARDRGKAAALTEVGNTQIATELESRWFSDHLLPLLRDSHLAYAMTWENRTSGPGQFWVPFVGHPGVPDFQAFAASSTTLFLGDVADLDQPPRDGHPTCTSCTADADGDRWGWEHDASCRVASWCLPSSSYPICERCDSDPDGDGWGWEHEQSCVRLATCR
jgi:mannan endo-1,4-beta-mannosidase